MARRPDEFSYVVFHSSYDEHLKDEKLSSTKCYFTPVITSYFVTSCFCDYSRPWLCVEAAIQVPDVMMRQGQSVLLVKQLFDPGVAPAAPHLNHVHVLIWCEVPTNRGRFCPQMQVRMALRYLHRDSCELQVSLTWQYSFTHQLAGPIMTLSINFFLQFGFYYPS